MVFVVALLIIGGLFLLTAICIIVVRLSFLIVTVQGESMTPTLWPGDRVLVCRFKPALRLREGQIVLVSQEDQSFQAPPYLKRILAMQGEEIPTGHVFVCGDNREQSIDSRLWGPIPQQRVIGVMLKKLGTGEPTQEMPETAEQEQIGSA